LAPFGEEPGLTETAVLAVLVAAAAGLVAGRAYAHARHRGLRDRPGFRTSPHYTQGLHYLASGQLSLAMSELTKVARDDTDAVDVLQVLSHLHRETGQVERAIQVHQALLARSDLTRAERAHALASLGADFRKAGFLDRAAQAFEEALAFDPNNIYALMGQRKVHEDQRQWREAYEVQTRLARLRKANDGLVLGHLQAQMGEDALAQGDREAAEGAFKAALALDRRVLPARLGLADLYLEREPARAVAVLEEVERTAPERAYLAFDRLERSYAALDEPERFVEMCERIIRLDARDWRARVALARHLRGRGRHDEAHGLLLRAVESNPQALLVHLELLATLRALGRLGQDALHYLAAAEESVFYADPHLCTECRYRADGMLWRCPHCHEWGTFVEERVGPMAAGS
jgi:lipopolysaccharide assembly protein B